MFRHINCINISSPQIVISYLLNVLLPSRMEYSSHNACYIPNYLINLAFRRHNNIRGHLYSVRLFIRQFSPSFCYFISLRSKYSPQHPVLTLSLCSSINATDKVSHPYKRTARSQLCIALFTGTESRRHRVYGPTCTLRPQSKGPVHSHQVRKCMHSMHDT
jgi:hypothetical protein